ncbi:unnamed protein product [Arabidopsis halleri]
MIHLPFKVHIKSRSMKSVDSMPFSIRKSGFLNHYFANSSLNR